MFDTFSGLGDAGLLAAIEEFTAAEATAAANRLSAIAELVGRRCRTDERAYWVCDEWSGAAAEVAAAMGVSHGRADGQMDLAVALRDRLPQVALLFAAGRLSLRVVTAIASRTALVEHPWSVDSHIAAKAEGWDALSQYRMEQTVDAIIERIDPGALRRTRQSVQGRDVSVGGRNHESGTAALSGRLLATDAAILERRLNAMAREVCEDDPRTLANRRADALGALAAGATNLSCQCGDPECPAAGPDARATSVVVHVLADPDALTAEPLAAAPEDPAPAEPVGEEPARDPGAAVIVGGGAIPTPLLAALLSAGAKVRYLTKPPPGAEPHYRPSTALDEFVRMRDLTCRFPNCDRPAEQCDVDHAVPWPAGPTHASNLRCLCRLHHLLRTFWNGPGGWRDVQDPDGTIVWTSPSGLTYTTVPGSRLVFPAWDTTTGALPRMALPEHGRGRDVMMPRRRRTRTDQRARRKKAERALNDCHTAERNRPPPF